MLTLPTEMRANVIPYLASSLPCACAEPCHAAAAINIGNQPVHTAEGRAAGRGSSSIGVNSLGPGLLPRCCVIRGRGARLEMQVRIYAVALALHGFHGRPQPFTLSRSIRVG